MTAIKQLTNTNLPVKAIASELGYRQTFDFARMFKGQCRLSPTRFRKANRLSPGW
jgi:AraC-like DNA-binding protein